MKLFVSVIIVISLTLSSSFAATAGPASRDGRIQENIRNDLVKRQPAIKSARLTTIGPEADIVRVIVKMIEGTHTRLSGKYISSLAGKDLTAVNALLADKSEKAIRRLTSKTPADVDRERSLLEARSGYQLADINNYLSIEVSSVAEAQDLVDRLNALPEVEIAYAEPRPELAEDIPPITDDFVNDQFYLDAAPTGVDADYANTLAGGDGTGVKIVDIEGSWKFDHEDLEAAVSGYIGGGLVNEISYRNHGTAVVGTMIGTDNGYGITGITPQAEIGMVGIGGISTAEAVLLAADNLEAGDVILIELHSPGPHYNFQSVSGQLGYVCMEYWQATFDAIQLASAKGIIVCEAAGNGSENFDDDFIYDNVFDTTYRNSHAIICGAGAPPSGNYGIPHSRLGFSNYGERVNLHGYGNEVVTTGYGDLFDGGGDERQYYTQYFSGTSSASPIVTASVAALQGIYKSRYAGAVMTADVARDALIASGTPQANENGEHIGPMPDLAGAEAILAPPPDLALSPTYFEVEIQEGNDSTIVMELVNNSTVDDLDYSMTINDLTKGASDWLSVGSSSGTVAASSSALIDVYFDAKELADQIMAYKGQINIVYGINGGPLDQSAAIPVFLSVPCFDTTFTAVASFDAGGPIYNWVDITSNGAEISLLDWYNESEPSSPADDGTAGPYALGFSFPFYGANYAQVYIGANGGLSFTDTSLNSGGYYFGLSIPGTPFSTFLAPFWNDINLDPSIGGNGSVFYRGTIDSFIIEFYHVGNFNDIADTMTTFEAILTSDGDVIYQYQSVGNTGLETTATIGVAAVECEALGYYSNGQPVGHQVSDGVAVRFSPGSVVWEMSGDVNGDGDVNVGDAVYIINYVFKGGQAPPVLQEADPNCDGVINVGDAVYIINYVFKGGNAPCMYQL